VTDSLRTRIGTAAVLLPPVLAVILFAGPLAFALGLGAFLLIAGWEWLRLCGMPSRPLRALWLAGLLALAAALYAFAPRPLVEGLILSGAAFWLLALLWLRHPHFGATPGIYACLLKALAGCFALLAGWLALVVLREGTEGVQWVLYLLALVWVADIGAYFSGRAIGGARLAPTISPGKTWAGFAGGMTASAALALIAGRFGFGLVGRDLAMLFLLSLASAMLSVVGDLFESLIKRQGRQKDSGRLLPGHGGVFDRIDSLLAAAPVFVAGKAWILP
jgi:phosphatidate cytidylyltransferase